MNDKPSEIDYLDEDICQSDQIHTADCDYQRDFSGIPCIEDRLSEARTRLNGCRKQHWLKDSVQKPELAQRRLFLKDGLLQKSFVYQGGEGSSQSVRSSNLQAPSDNALTQH
jgi:hypothetical protein